jgi:hypothetical protein
MRYCELIPFSLLDRRLGLHERGVEMEFKSLIEEDHHD